MLRIVGVIGLLFLTLPSMAQDTAAPDASDTAVLQVCEGIVQLFEQAPDAVWPGFNLAKTPLIVYRADRWALLLGSDAEVEGFGPYPQSWPRLGFPVQFHAGAYAQLAGQLVFDFRVGGAKAVAVGMPEDISGIRGLADMPRESVLFGFIVHEAFHQYQSQAFGEIPWEREERYPMLDRDNTALACMEMRILMDAVRQMRDDKRSEVGRLIRSFAAVRQHRWKTAPAFVKRFEQGLEIREGTAKYVEVRATDLARRLKYDSHLPVKQPLSEILSGSSAAQLLLADFDSRFTDGAVSPEDMPRNRVYPVGAAQGVLLDYLGVEWKEEAQRAGPDFTFVQLLETSVGGSDADADRLVADAKRKYAFDEIVAATQKLIDDYERGYRDALATFEGQPGERVEVELSSNGVTRSRVSGGRRWIVNEGRRTLANKYAVYSLKNDDLQLQVKDSGILEDDDWDARRKTVVFFARGNVAVTLDGDERLTPEDNRLHAFQRVRVAADNVTLEYTQPGSLRRTGDRLSIRLLAE